MKKLITLLALFAASTQAADYKLIIPISSKHIGSDYNYNEENYGLGLQVNDLGVIAYKNSYSDTSVMAYYDINKSFDSGVSVGVSIGAVTGYEYADVIPIAQPYVEYGGFNISVIPTGFVSYSDTKAVVVFSYRIDL
jgi:hypothetical protein